jgi:mRNA-degrading endonuclease toxin of MazEF toxin-antitoxin module
MRFGNYRVIYWLYAETKQIKIYDIDSVALVFQLRAIDKKRLKNKIGKMEQTQLGLLKQTLKDIMGLE